MVLSRICVDVPCWEILCIYRMVEQQTGVGCRGRQPLHICDDFFVAKSLAFFADLTLCYGIEKAVQSFSLRHRFVFGFLLFIRGYPYTSCPLPPILDSRQDTVSRLPDFVCILKYLICQLVSRFRQLLYGLFIHSRTDRRQCYYFSFIQCHYSQRPYPAVERFVVA